MRWGVSSCSSCRQPPATRWQLPSSCRQPEEFAAAHDCTFIFRPYQNISYNGRNVFTQLQNWCDPTVYTFFFYKKLHFWGQASSFLAKLQFQASSFLSSFLGEFSIFAEKYNKNIKQGKIFSDIYATVIFETVNVHFSLILICDLMKCIYAGESISWWHLFSNFVFQIWGLEFLSKFLNFWAKLRPGT